MGGVLKAGLKGPAYRPNHPFSMADTNVALVKIVSLSDWSITLYDVLRSYRYNEEWCDLLNNTVLFYDNQVRRTVNSYFQRVWPGTKETYGVVTPPGVPPSEWFPEEHALEYFKKRSVGMSPEGDNMNFHDFSLLADYTVYERKPEHEYSLDLFDMIWENQFEKLDLNHEKRKREYCIVAKHKGGEHRYYMMLKNKITNVSVGTVVHDGHGNRSEFWTYRFPVLDSTCEHRCEQLLHITNDNWAMIIEELLYQCYQPYVQRWTTADRIPEVSDMSDQENEEWDEYTNQAFKDLH